MEMVIFHASFRFGKTRGRSFQSNVVLIEMEHKTCNFSVQPILGVATGMTYWIISGGRIFWKKLRGNRQFRVSWYQEKSLPERLQSFSSLHQKRRVFVWSDPIHLFDIWPLESNFCKVETWSTLHVTGTRTAFVRWCLRSSGGCTAEAPRFVVLLQLYYTYVQ